MIPHVRRRAKQLETAGKVEAQREAARQIALAVSLALRKAEQEAKPMVEELKAENAELRERVEEAEASKNDV